MTKTKIIKLLGRETFFDSLPNVLFDIWPLASVNNQDFRLIDLLYFTCRSVEDDTVRRLYPNTKQQVNGYFIPNSDKNKLNLILAFYFIVKIKENEHKVFFMNYSITEEHLFYNNLTSYLYKDFLRSASKTLVKNQLDTNEKYYVDMGCRYIFKLGGLRNKKGPTN